MIPPAGWGSVVSEMERLVAALGVAADSALATVMRVQLAMLPGRDRTFPARVHLAHDYPAWHAAVRAAQSDRDRGPWESRVPPLRAFGPGVLVVNDPNGVCADPTSGTIFSRNLQGGVWELDSSVARDFVVLGRPNDRPDPQPIELVRRAGMSG
jgi:hypothetical protein